MLDLAIDFLFDSGAFMLVVLAIPLVLIVAQWRLISRTEGLLRWVAAAPSLILGLFVVLNVISPSNIWPIALVFWAVIAIGVHCVVWVLVKVAGRLA